MTEAFEVVSHNDMNLTDPVELKIVIFRLARQIFDDRSVIAL